MTNAPRPPACHFAHQMSTAFSYTPNTAAASSRFRPATNAATARNRPSPTWPPPTASQPHQRP
ncbi:hypothetical protein [Streptomyces sp. JW3]|uniref:hypothetical protein n=1 Tax=Streptomyces sp. JW3 TaxID=3456955 RepID=UPI003FA4C542